MMYHILNGDSLLHTFNKTGIEGEAIICRECLIECPTGGNTLEEFFELRSQFIFETYINNSGENSEKKYKSYVKSEFDKVLDIPSGSEIILWFEHDLFCQANMWFMLSLLKPFSNDLIIFRALPIHKNPEDIWMGFGKSTVEDLIESYNNKIKLSTDDIALGNELWQAYKNNDLNMLKEHSLSSGASFPFLKDVVKAHIDRFPSNGLPGRPEKVLGELINSGKNNFEEVFAEFWKREGIYGFGDAQVKRMYDKITLKR